MVKQYLEKIQNDFFVKKIEIKNQIMDLNNQYKESIEMIKLLQESDDPTFDVFTPREVNSFNRVKVDELKESQVSIQSQLVIKKEELRKIEEDIEEVNNVLKNENSTIQKMKIFSEKIDKCLELVVLERYQCKMELSEMKEMIDEITKNY
jgi:two-component system sensor histidine kinase DegS